jgi:hypothetical protein
VNQYLTEFLDLVGHQYDWNADWESRLNYGRDFSRYGLGSDLRMNTIIREEECKQRMRCEYAYAIPCDDAISAIAKHGNVVEIGAGTGYWAMLLEEAGVDVVCYDNRCSHFLDHQYGKYHEVLDGGPMSAGRHSDRTLFLCWPPYDDPMASDCLLYYKGDTIAFVGEDEGGCTGDERFFELLNSHYEEVDQKRIPQWDAIHDYLSIWKRR